MKMNKITEAIPFALLLGLVPHFYLHSPSISQSIIIVAISALCGYRLYCIDKIKPNYVELFKQEFEDYKNLRDEELQELRSKHEHAMVHLDAKVQELNANYGKVTMDQTRKRETPKFEF